MCNFLFKTTAYLLEGLKVFLSIHAHLEPLPDVVEGYPVGNVVDDDDAVRTAVVRGRDSAKPFLAGRVPDLQLDRFPVEMFGADFEVDADGGDERLRVCIVSKAEEETRLAHPRVSDQQQFEKVIVFEIHV